MAERDYVRLAPVCHCGQPVTLTGKRGRPPKQCEEHRRKQEGAARPKKPAPERECLECQGPVPPKHRYCTAACQAAAKAKRPKKVDKRRPKRVICWHCGKESWRRVRGGEWDAGRYCDWFCAAARRSLIAKEVAGIKRLTTPLQDEVVERRRAVRRLLRELRALERAKAKEEARAAAAARPCVDCGQPCGASVMGRPRVRCDTCGEAEKRRARGAYRHTEQHRRIRRIAKSKRRALIRATKVEPIDPLEVFERDGWRCHLCKRKTPKALRGTIDDRAPELDHIVSLADGGSHTWGNVACSCRACNHAKGARSRGQLLLA